MADPTVQVKDGAGSYVATPNGVNVTAGNVITIKLSNPTDVRAWSVLPVGVDDLTDPTTVVPTVDIVSKTATFTMPAGAHTIIFQSLVTNGLGVASFVTFGVYALTGTGGRLIAGNETIEGNTRAGWVASMNAVLRNPQSFPTFVGGPFGVGGAAPAGSQFYVSGAGGVTFARSSSTSGSPVGFVFTGAAHTGMTTATEVPDLDINLQRTVTWATGAIPIQRSARIRRPTYAFAGASVVTRAATFAVDGAPVAGANATLTQSWAVWVAGDASRFDGRLEVNGGAEGVRVLRFSADAFGTVVRFVKTRGANEDAAIAAVQANDELGGIAAIGQDSSGATGGDSGRFVFQADDAFTSTAHGTKASLQLTPPGSIVKTEVLGVDGRGVHRQVAATAAPSVNPTNALSFYVDPSNLLPQWRRPSGEIVIVDTIDPSPMGHRLTLTTGVPVASADVNSSNIIYMTPSAHGTIMLFDGSLWRVRITGEISITLTGLTTSKNYDVFAYWNGSAVALELSAPWTSDVARADALSLLGGVRVKASNTTRRYIGTFRAVATTATTDTVLNRFLWNAYNQVQRPLSVKETASSWAYTTAAVRQSNANTANQVGFVCGDASASLEVHAKSAAASATVATFFSAGIGIDSAATNIAINSGSHISTANVIMADFAEYRGQPGLGYHFAAWLEYGGAGITMYGADPVRRTGLHGYILG